MALTSIFSKILDRDENNKFSQVPLFSPVTSGVFTTWASLLESQTPKSIYSLYKAQENEYIQAAQINADRIRAKGDVELRNLDYKHRIQRGSDVMAVAGAGGKLSGSFVDVMMMKAKFQMMDEAIVKTNTEVAAYDTMREGYINAANVARTASIRAEGDMRNVWGSVLKGVRVFMAEDLANRQELGRQDSLVKIQEMTKQDALTRIKTELGLTENSKTEYDSYNGIMQDTMKDVVEGRKKGTNFSILGDFGTTYNTGEEGGLGGVGLDIFGGG